jgi:hypothetical protein
VTEQPADLATRLFARAVREEQASHRLHTGEDAAAIRQHVRRLARDAGVRIRTGLVEDSVVVIRADAALWDESAAVMRAKLQPED